MGEPTTVKSSVPMISTSHATPALAIRQAEKSRKFSSIDFKRWQQNMFFYLTTLSLQRLITEDALVLSEKTPENERFVVKEAWTHSDFLCKNYILNGLEDGRYNVYNVCKSSKELWNALDKKYKAEDARLKKFVAAKFLKFKMIDSKFVMSQVQELQIIIHDLLAEGMVINEVFKVVAFIEKFPPLWKDFKNYLRHKCKEMKLEDLIVRLRIEEDNRSAEKKASGKLAIARANIVETAPTTSKKRKRPIGPKNLSNKKKFKENCYNCGKFDHTSFVCRAPKKDNKKDQANMTEMNKVMDNLCAMLSECNLVGNPKE